MAGCFGRSVIILSGEEYPYEANKTMRRRAALCLQINARRVILFLKRLLCLLNALLSMMSQYSIDRLISPPHKLGLMPRSLSVPPGQTDGPDGLMGERRKGGRRASRPTGEAAELELVILPPLRTAGSARTPHSGSSQDEAFFLHRFKKSFLACLPGRYMGRLERNYCMHTSLSPLRTTLLDSGCWCVTAKWPNHAT